MRVGINLVSFVPGGMGGIETYCKSLLSAISQLDEKNEYLILCDERYMSHFGGLRSFSFHGLNFSKPSIRWFVRGVVRNIAGWDLLAPAMNRVQADIIHHPFSFLNPLRLKIPSVLTFHDMQHEFFPEYFSSFEMKTRNELYRPSPALATRVIAISEHAKKCLVDRYQVAPGKIDVVHNGFDPAHFRHIDEDSIAAVKSKYGLERPFLYYPAATWPHKNHRRLLAALRLMKDRYAFDGLLVLTGIAMHGQTAILEDIENLGLEQSVKVLGYVPYAEIPALYRLARAMVFPSLFEGFGIPLVEAMASGCPVACSAVTSIPEVMGDVGVYFDPESVEEIAEKVWSLWTDDVERARRAAEGLTRAERFTWADAAKKTISVYERTT